MTTQARKLQFVRERLGPYGLGTAAQAMVNRKGADWLTDEQIQEIFAAEVASYRLEQKLNRDNRKRHAARQQERAA